MANANWKRTLRLLSSLFQRLSFQNKRYRAMSAPMLRVCVAKLQNLKADYLHVSSYWRDLFALTNTFRTFMLSEQIISAWEELSTTHQPSDFKYIKRQRSSCSAGARSANYCWPLHVQNRRVLARNWVGCDCDRRRWERVEDLILQHRPRGDSCIWQPGPGAEGPRDSIMRQGHQRSGR